MRRKLGEEQESNSDTCRRSKRGRTKKGRTWQKNSVRSTGQHFPPALKCPSPQTLKTSSSLLLCQSLDGCQKHHLKASLPSCALTHSILLPLHNIITSSSISLIVQKFHSLGYKVGLNKLKTSSKSNSNSVAPTHFFGLHLSWYNYSYHLLSRHNTFNIY